MLYNRVYFATATTGTGTITAGAAETGFRTMLDAAIPDGIGVEYLIFNGADWETGTGIVGGTSTTMTRSVSQSSNSNALVSFASGAKVMLTPNAEQYNKLQPSLWNNSVSIWFPTTATGGQWLNTVGAGAGTYTTQLPTTTSVYTSMKRGRWANVITTANQVLGQRNTEAMFYRSSAARQGGFFFHARGGFDVWTNGGRFFAGLHTGTTVVSGSPYALNNTIGFGVDAADNGAIFAFSRDGTAFGGAATGLTIVSGKGYDCLLIALPNSSQVFWRIEDINTGTVASGVLSTNLPVAGTMLTAGFLASNAALTAATAIQVACNKIYVQSDY